MVVQISLLGHASIYTIFFKNENDYVAVVRNFYLRSSLSEKANGPLEPEMWNFI
jgi:hypothetical protein